jgi:hypothetical protein
MRYRSISFRLLILELTADSYKQDLDDLVMKLCLSNVCLPLLVMGSIRRILSAISHFSCLLCEELDTGKQRLVAFNPC